MQRCRLHDDLILASLIGLSTCPCNMGNVADAVGCLREATVKAGCVKAAEGWLVTLLPGAALSVPCRYGCEGSTS